MRNSTNDLEIRISQNTRKNSRGRKSKNCFSRETIIAATYKLFMESEKRWKLIRGKNRIAQVINMEKFIDGIHESEINNDNLNEKKYAA